MRLRFRCWIIMVLALFRKGKLPITQPSRVTFVIMPWDCVLLYAGNDRYHAFLDLARMDLAIRLGWLGSIIKRRWRPQVINCYIRHRSPLKVFSQLVIYSYIADSNNKYIWMAHRFEYKGRVVATAISKLAVVSRTGIANLSGLPSPFARAHIHGFTNDSLRAFGSIDQILRNLNRYYE